MVPLCHRRSSRSRTIRDHTGVIARPHPALGRPSSSELPTRYVLRWCSSDAVTAVSGVHRRGREPLLRRRPRPDTGAADGPQARDVHAIPHAPWTETRPPIQRASFASVAQRSGTVPWPGEILNSPRGPTSPPSPGAVSLPGQGSSRGRCRGVRGRRCRRRVRHANPARAFAKPPPGCASSAKEATTTTRPRRCAVGAARRPAPRANGLRGSPRPTTRLATSHHPTPWR